MQPSPTPIEPAAPPDAPAASPAAPARRRRSILAGVALLLACLTIVLATTALWVHQVVLNTDRFTATVTDIVEDPAFIAPIATKVSQQVVTALDVQTRLQDQLPGPSKLLAGTMSAAVQGIIERQLGQALENPRVRDALLTAISRTHARLVRFLRGDSTALTIVDGKVQLNVYPVIGAAITELQSIGVIPADAKLPDLTADEAPSAINARLQTALGITLPADFGTIPLMEAKRLETAQTLVTAFDVVVIVLIALAILLSVLAVWLATNRRRMVIYLSIGVIVAFIIARSGTRWASSSVVDGIADAGLRGSALAVLDAVVNAFVGFTTVVLIATVILLIVAYLAGRPAWLTRLTSGSEETTPSAS